MLLLLGFAFSWIGATVGLAVRNVEAVQSEIIGGGPDYDGWAKRLHEAGLMCVGWPKEYGGRGLSGLEVAVMNEEFARAGVPRVTRGMGEWLVGPSIIVHGTEEQKAHFLPGIVDGTDRYCQGFSEPDAGSDLAGLKTRGVVDGDEIVGVADDDNVATRDFLPPDLGPQVENIVQIHVREQR